jgi:membrane peptidoglycan carboxypeptidase
MRKVVNSGAAGTGSRGRTLCPTGGKTGTATAGTDEDQHVSSSWFAGYTPKLATVVMYNRGVGNEDLEGYMVPFYGGTFPAMTFKAYMDAVVDPTNCGEFIPPGNIRSTRGVTYAPKPQKEKKKSGNGGGSGGNGSGGNGSGGNNSGGNNNGGNDPGGNDPGGNDPGGNDPGGNDPGGNDSGGGSDGDGVVGG